MQAEQETKLGPLDLGHEIRWSHILETSWNNVGKRGTYRTLCGIVLLNIVPRAKSNNRLCPDCKRIDG